MMCSFAWISLRSYPRRMRRYSWISCSHNTSQPIIYSSKPTNSDSGKDSIVPAQVNQIYRSASKQSKRRRQHRDCSQVYARNYRVLRRTILRIIMLIPPMMNRRTIKRTKWIRLSTQRIIALCRLICCQWQAWSRIKCVKITCRQRSMKKRSISGSSSGNKVRHSDTSRVYFKLIAEDGRHCSSVMSLRRMSLL